MTSRDKIINDSLSHVPVTQLLDAATIVDEEDYQYYAPVYTTKLIRSYGPVPVCADNGTVVSLGILGEITNSEARVAMFNKWEQIHKPTSQKVYPYFSVNGPVVFSGINNLGTISKSGFRTARPWMKRP